VVSIVGLFLAIFFIGLSQILRVRLLNVLIDPHFSVGLRSGIFMNSIGSFLNIITPFRLGEVYRYSFMRKKYQSNRLIILNAISIERMMDAGSLVLIIISLYGLNTLNILKLQTSFLMILILVYLTIFALANKVSIVTKNASLTKQIFYLGKSRAKEIFILFQAVWATYLIAGFLVTLVYSEDFRGWMIWNVSSFRVINFMNGEINLSWKYNDLFVLIFLFFGIVIAFFGHQSNRFLDRLTSSKSDSLTKEYTQSVLFQSRNRDLFLSAPISKYWREVKKKDLCLEIYNGGSGAVVFSLATNPYLLRKVAFGRQRPRLIDQHDFLKKHFKKWNFPYVENPTLGRDYFSFDMEKIYPSKTIYEELVLCHESDLIEAHATRIFEFIDTANLDVGFINQADLRSKTEVLWNKKLQRILKQTKLQIPWFFVHKSIDINGRSFKNLEIVFEEIRRIVISIEGLSSITTPHGDSTLGNLLVRESDLQIRGIDPNPSQIIRNVSIDHGKVLQSLMGQYEDLMASGDILEIGLGYVFYTQMERHSIEIASEKYLQLLAVDSKVFKHSQIMCFVSMMRLLPYRLEQDPKSAPIFAARTIELGNRILSTIK